MRRWVLETLVILVGFVVVVAVVVKVMGNLLMAPGRGGSHCEITALPPPPPLVFPGLHWFRSGFVWVSLVF